MRMPTWHYDNIACDHIEHLTIDGYLGSAFYHLYYSVERRSMFAEALSLFE